MSIQDSPLLTFQLAGFPSIVNGGNPANGTGLLGSVTLEYWPNGQWVAQYVLNSVTKRVILENDPKWNQVFDQILKGTNGLSTGFTDTAGLHPTQQLFKGA